MTIKEKIFFGIFLLVYTFGFSILILKYDFKIRMLPICAGQGFYVYYDSDEKMCKCYNGYSKIDGKIGCFRKQK